MGTRGRGGSSSVWEHLVFMVGLGWGACFQRCSRLGALSPAPEPVSVFPSLGLRVWVWLGIDMPRAQMCSYLSGDTRPVGLSM